MDKLDDTAEGLPQVLTLAEVQKVARISKAMLYRLLRDDLGPPSFKLGRRRLFKAEAVRAWLRKLAEVRHD